MKINSAMTGDEFQRRVKKDAEQVLHELRNRCDEEGWDYAECVLINVIADFCEMFSGRTGNLYNVFTIMQRIGEATCGLMESRCEVRMEVHRIDDDDFDEED